MTKTAQERAAELRRSIACHQDQLAGLENDVAESGEYLIALFAELAELETELEKQ